MQLTRLSKSRVDSSVVACRRTFFGVLPFGTRTDCCTPSPLVRTSRCTLASVCTKQSAPTYQHSASVIRSERTDQNKITSEPASSRARACESFPSRAAQCSAVHPARSALFTPFGRDCSSINISGVSWYTTDHVSFRLSFGVSRPGVGDARPRAGVPCAAAASAASVCGIGAGASAFSWRFLSALRYQPAEYRGFSSSCSTGSRLMANGGDFGRDVLAELPTACRLCDAFASDAWESPGLNGVLIGSTLTASSMSTGGGAYTTRFGEAAADIARAAPRTHDAHSAADATGSRLRCRLRHPPAAQQQDRPHHPDPAGISLFTATAQGPRGGCRTFLAHYWSLATHAASAAGSQSISRYPTNGPAGAPGGVPVPVYRQGL